jgi:OOP family OmpA-OmpF porin
MRGIALRLMLAAAMTALAFGLIPTDASAETEAELSALVGVLFPDDELISSREDPNNVSPMIGLRAALRMGWWGLFTDGMFAEVDPPLPLDNASELLFRGGLEVFGPPHWGSGDTYLAASPGLMRLGLEDDSQTEFMLSAGIGQVYRVSDRGRLRWEFRGERIFVDENEFFSDDLNQFELLLGAGIAFGGGSRDEDNDGVPDNEDICPDTPRGWTVDRRGCPLDSDGDDVPDAIDDCPRTPKGAIVDQRGCPKDSDQDGVYDGIDQCPNTPRNVKVNAKGCPEAEALFPPEKKDELILEGVNFETDSEKLTEDSRDTLDRVAESLRAYPDTRVEIGGHTDSRNSEAYNLDLSRRRAESVMSYLLSHGVSAEQLKTRGYGESKPIASNKTTAGMAKNRRVELKKID